MSRVNYDELKVLIVDDFNSFRLALNKMLYELGFRHIDSAVSGVEALNFCKKERYDLLLCDYNLGSGKNGQQLLEELRQQNLLKKQDVFILLSAETSRNVVMSANDYEPDAYLTKPITNKMIEQRLGRLLNRRREMLSVFSLLEADQKEEAINELNEKISQNSRYSMECQKLLAELYVELSKFDEAEKIYRNVLEMRSLNWAQVGLSQVRLASGDAQTAAKWLGEIVKVNPSYLKAYDVLIDALQATDDLYGVQKALQQAVSISPLSLGRQAQLAKTALINGDAEISAKAFRQVIKHGENSRHDKLDNYIDFAKSVAQCFDKNVDQAEAYTKDVLSLFAKIENKFEISEDVALQTQMLSSQLLSLKGEKSKAEELLATFSSVVDESNLNDIDLEVELVRTYFANQRAIDAHRLLDKMIKHYCNDQAALEKIDPLLSEPVSINGKKLLAKINKNGISAYQTGNFTKSISYFSRAEKRFPRYIGIKLNLAQALIGKIKTDDREERDVNQCLAIFDVVKRHVRQDQPHHKRFIQLQEMLRIIAAS